MNSNYGFGSQQNPYYTDAPAFVPQYENQGYNDQYPHNNSQQDTYYNNTYNGDQSFVPQHQGQSYPDQYPQNNYQQNHSYTGEQALTSQYDNSNQSYNSQNNTQEYFESPLEPMYFQNSQDHYQQNPNTNIYPNSTYEQGQGNYSNPYSYDGNQRTPSLSYPSTFPEEQPFMNIPQVSHFTEDNQTNQRDDNIPIFFEKQNERYNLPEPSQPPPAPPTSQNLQSNFQHPQPSQPLEPPPPPPPSAQSPLQPSKPPPPPPPPLAQSPLQPSEPPPPPPPPLVPSPIQPSEPPPPAPVSQLTDSSLPSSKSSLLPVDSDLDSDKHLDIGIYLLKSAIVHRKLENLKTTKVTVTPPPTSSSQTFLNVPQPKSHTSNYQTSASPSHSFSRHRRQSSVSSTSSTSSYKSIDIKPVFIQTSGPDSGKLFSKFTENLKLKIVRDYTTTKIFSDPLTRIMVGKFINDLTPEKIKQIDSEKRLESIITLFIACANDILLKQGNNTHQNISEEISRHTNEFVNYLIFYIKKSSRGLLSGKRSALVKDLEKYSESLKKNTRLEPKKTVVKSASESRRHRYGHLRSSSGSYTRVSSSSDLTPYKSNSSVSSFSKTQQSFNSLPNESSKKHTTIKVERNNNYIVDFKNDPIFQYIINLFEIPDDVVPQLSESLIPLSTDTAALNDLRKSESDLKLYKHPVYNLDNFLSENIKNQWIEQENINISSDIKILKEKAPYLNDEPQIPTDQLSSYVFIPSDPIDKFKTVALYLMEYEYNTFKDNQANYQANGAKFEFSKNAKTILSFIEVFWRLSPVTIGVILLSEGERLKTELYSSRVYVDIIFPYIISLYLEGTQDTSKLWHDVEKKLSYDLMTIVLDDMTNLAIEDLSLVNYEATIAVFSSLSKNISEYIQPFSSFEEYDELEFSDNCECAFKEQIHLLVGQKFDEQCSDIYKHTDFELLDFLKLCLIVQDTTKTLRSKLKGTLVGFNIRNMTVSLYLSPFFQFVNDITSKIQLDIELETGISFSSEDIRKILDSFAYIVNYYEQTQKNSPASQQHLSASLIFEKFSQGLSENLINKFSSEVNLVLKNKVLKSLKNEDYNDLDSNLKITKNLFDAFKVFNLHLTLLEGHTWNPSFTNAKMYLIFVSGITEVLIQYSEFLLSSVRSDLKESKSEVPIENNHSYQEKLSQLINNISLQDEIFRPYSFEISTCIKMNNIQWALYQFQLLDIDYQPINQVLFEDADSFAFFYKIKIIKAKDLPAIDRNGLSDPYVLIQKGEDMILKTKTIYKTLTPVWNEIFEVQQLNENEKVKLKFMVWDENKIMMDQLCGGSVTIDLDPKQFFNKPPTERWYNLNESGQLLLHIELVVKNSGSIIYQYNSCVRQLFNANQKIFDLVISKFSQAIKYYISSATIDKIFGFTVKLNDTVSDYFSKWTDKQHIFQANTEQQNKYVCLLTPLFEYLDENLLIFLQNLSEDAFRSMLLECWYIFVDSLITLVVPDIGDRKSTYQPLKSERKDLIMTWMRVIKEFVNHDDDGVPFDELEATPKYMLFMKLMNFDYSRSTREIIDDCEHLRVEMDKIKCSYKEDVTSSNQSPDAAQNDKMITPFELQNKISKYGRKYDDTMNQFEMFLRLLLLRGNVKTVDDFLSVI